MSSIVPITVAVPRLLPQLRITWSNLAVHCAADRAAAAPVHDVLKCPASSRSLSLAHRLAFFPPMSVRGDAHLVTRGAIIVRFRY